jgi:cytoskeleton protein RodZ
MHKGSSYDSVGNAEDSFKGDEMTQSDLGLLTVGQALREAREGQKLKIENISAILKIREDHLTALEEDDFDLLPGSVYAIGFIRTYSKHLGLDASNLIERYKSNNAPAPKPELDLDIAEEKEPISDRMKIIIGVVAVLSLLLIWLLVSGPDDSAMGEAEGEGVRQEGVAAASAPPQAPRQDPSPVAPVVPAPASHAAAQDNADAAVPETPAAPAPQQGEAAPSALDPTDAEAQGDETASVEPAPAELAVSEPLLPNVIEVRSRRRTWMRVESDAGQVLFSSIIDAGRSFRLPDGDDFVLATRDAGALEYVLNGEAIGAVGRRGQILTNRRLNRAEIIDRNR